MAKIFVTENNQDKAFWGQFGSTITLRQNQQWQRNYKAKVRTEVLTHYGRGKLACVKCGFDDIRALSIDHIEACKGKRPHNTMTYLRKNNFPEGYQTLCMNCQFIKRIENKEHK